MSESSSESEPNTDTRKRSRHSSKGHRTKRRKEDDEFSAYEKYARWQARSNNPFIDYFSVLDIGIRWERRAYGKLTSTEFHEKYIAELRHYIDFRDSITDYKTDFPALVSSSRALNKLSKVMHTAAAAARGDDIASLNNHGLKYIALEQPGKQLVPDIAADADKTLSRGHNHPTMSRLLCPARLLQEFDANPTEYMRKLKRNEIKVRASDFPSLLYPKDGYDPDDVESNLLQSPIALRFFRSIFTSPGSAILENGGKTKAKSCQAKLNGMTEVTPGSIAYCFVLLRHFLTGIKDWRVEDDLFSREEFHSAICSLFDDEGSDWVKDTLDWWNMHVFGCLPTNVNDEDVVQPVISTLNILKEQRARKAAARQQAAGEIPNDAPPHPAPEHDTHDLPPAQPEQLENPPDDGSETEPESIVPDPEIVESETEPESLDLQAEPEQLLERALPGLPTRVDPIQWDFSDQTLPPGFNRKAKTSNNLVGPQVTVASSERIPPIRIQVAKTHVPAVTSAPPVASTSSSVSAQANLASRLPVQQVPSSEPQLRLGERPVPSQASNLKRPRPHAKAQQTQATQQRHSSPRPGPGRRSKKKTSQAT